MSKPYFEILKKESKPTKAAFKERFIWYGTTKTTTSIGLYKHNYPQNNENYRVTILVASIDDLYMGQDYMFQTFEEAKIKYDEVKTTIYDKIPRGFTMQWLRDHNLENY